MPEVEERLGQTRGEAGDLDEAGVDAAVSQVAAPSLLLTCWPSWKYERRVPYSVCERASNVATKRARVFSKLYERELWSPKATANELFALKFISARMKPPTFKQVSVPGI